MQRGWPQEQLAQIADVSPRTIQRVEAGGNASHETLRSIASALDVEIRELLVEQEAFPSIDSPDSEAAGHPSMNSEFALLLARSNRRLRILSGTLSFLILMMAAFAGWAHFRRSSPVAVGPDAPDPQTRSMTEEIIPPDRTTFSTVTHARREYTPFARSRAGIRQGPAGSREASDQPESRHGDAFPALSPEIVPPDNLIPGYKTGTLLLEITRSFQPVPLLATTPAGPVTVRGSITGPQERTVELPASEGLASRVKHASTSHALSTSGTMRRSSKQIANFFARLGETMKKSF